MDKKVDYIIEAIYNKEIKKRLKELMEDNDTSMFLNYNSDFSRLMKYILTYYKDMFGILFTDRLSIAKKYKQKSRGYNNAKLRVIYLGNENISPEDKGIGKYRIEEVDINDKETIRAEIDYLKPFFRGLSLEELLIIANR